MNEKLRLVLLIVFGLLLAALLSRNAALAWMALPFLFFLGAGLLTSPGEVRLRASRLVSHVRCEAGTPITMTVTIKNDGPTLACLRIDEMVWPNEQVIDGDVNRTVRLPEGETTEMRYTFHAPRGECRWTMARITVSDPFRLFEKKMELAAEAEVRVLPDSHVVQQLRLRPRQTLRAPGPNLSRLAGSGVDFYGVRQYHAGDSLRWVHWRLSARHPRQFFSKEFEREEMADVGLILDGSAAGNLACGKEELFEYSVQAAAALSRTALRMGNRLSLLVLGEHVTRVFPGTGKRQLVRILDALAGCQPGEKASLNMLRYLPVRLFPSHSLLIIISPLRASDIPVISRLRASGYQVLLVSPDPVRFASREPHSPLACRAALVERQALLWRVREIGARAIDWPVDQPLMNAAGAFIHEQGERR